MRQFLVLVVVAFLGICGWLTFEKMSGGSSRVATTTVLPASPGATAPSAPPKPGATTSTASRKPATTTTARAVTQATVRAPTAPTVGLVATTTTAPTTTTTTARAIAAEVAPPSSCKIHLEKESILQGSTIDGWASWNAPHQPKALLSYQPPGGAEQTPRDVTYPTPTSSIPGSLEVGYRPFAFKAPSDATPGSVGTVFLRFGSVDAPPRCSGSFAVLLRPGTTAP